MHTTLARFRCPLCDTLHLPKPLLPFFPSLSFYRKLLLKLVASVLFQHQQFPDDDDTSEETEHA